MGYFKFDKKIQKINRVRRESKLLRRFNEIEKKLWSLLANAVKDRGSEFRTPVFICGNDKNLDGRVVVLRKADQKNNFIQFGQP